MISIALDAMGGDHGPSAVVPAALDALKTYDDLELTLVGDQTVLRQVLSEYKVTEHPRLHIHHASQVVAMNELPSVALRTKKDSSMRVAINLVKQDVVKACVSAGNTGALMATARFVLKTLDGIDRPAIMAELPNQYGNVRVLDLGANVDSYAEHLLQFAVMGSVLTSAMDNIDRPRIGLLNIGAEEIKGNEQVKQTAHLLEQMPELNYIGYVEADDICYRRPADVIVCDGFIGNVALKATEGVAKLILHYVRAAFRRNPLTRFVGVLVYPILKSVVRKIDPTRYNGASFLGLNGIVIKSHGGADHFAFRYAIDEAIREVKHNVPHLIRQRVSDLLLGE